MADGFDAGQAAVVLDPTGLVAAHKSNVQAALKHMVQHGHVFGHAQGIVGVEYIAKYVHFEAL